MLIPAVIAGTLFLAVALAWHAVAGHHAHYKLIRLFRPGPAAPPVRQDAGWHALPWRRRALAGSTVLLASALAGLAWYLSPVATLACAAPMAVTVTVVAVLRGLGRLTAPPRRRRTGGS